MVLLLMNLYSYQAAMGKEDVAEAGPSGDKSVFHAKSETDTLGRFVPFSDIPNSSTFSLINISQRFLYNPHAGPLHEYPHVSHRIQELDGAPQGPQAGKRGGVLPAEEIGGHVGWAPKGSAGGAIFPRLGASPPHRGNGRKGAVQYSRLQ